MANTETGSTLTPPHQTHVLHKLFWQVKD